ncbi:MAG: TolC family outer membrane protein [Pseudomonadota bacterium]|nr:TolC family outer membrane protein [Pseudomonadota bacterium]
MEKTVASAISICLVSASLFAAGLGFSAQATSLDEAISQTLARNPSLASAQSSYEATYASQFVSLADMLPNITAFATSTMSNTDAEFYNTGAINTAANIGDTDTDSYGVQVTQNLFGSGRYVNAFRSKRAEIRSEAKNLVNTEQQIILKAVTAYLDVMRDQLISEVNEQNVVVLSKQLEAVKDRFEVGVVTRTDIAQSEARFAGAKSNYLSARARLLGARAVYREIIGLEPENLTLPQSLPSLPESLDAARSSARAANPILASAREMSDSGRLSAYSAIGMALPSIAVVGSHTFTEDPSTLLVGTETEVTSVQVQVKVPIFMGGRSIAGVSAAYDYSDALARNVHAAANAVERSVIVAWNNYEATTAAISARQQQIAASEVALEGVREENNLGIRTNLDVLDAEQDLLDARVTLVQAERDQWVAAYALLSSMGHLTGARLGIRAADIDLDEIDMP